MPTEPTPSSSPASSTPAQSPQPAPAPPRPWLTVAEVAADLHVTAKSVRRLIKGGQLKAKNISTGVRANWRIHTLWMEAFRQESTLGNGQNTD